MKRKATVELAREDSPSVILEEFSDDEQEHDQEEALSTVEHSASSVVLSTPVTTAASTTVTRRFPSDLKTIKCTWPNCAKTFNRPARLTAHLRSHTNDRPFKCSQCPKTYMEEKHLRQHVKGSHTQERRYICGECNKAFLTATRLRRHAAVHEGQNRFRCQGYDAACTRTFRKHQTLQRHIRVDHLGQSAFVCNHMFSSSSSSTDGTQCNAAFDSAGALRRHIERAHAPPKYWCAECPLLGAHSEGRQTVGFPTRALLEAHMRHEHATCMFCEARCSGAAELHHHIDMYHSGKSIVDRKTFGCPYDSCGKTFTRRPNLNVHIRTAHEGLRFVCGDKGALGTGGVNSLKLTHPYLSDWDAASQGCGRGFVSKVKLEEHILYVHLHLDRPPPLPISGTRGAPYGDASVSAPADMIGALTGSNRILTCPHEGCAARFVRHHDLHTHLERDHPLEDAAPPITVEANEHLGILKGNIPEDNSMDACWMGAAADAFDNSLDDGVYEMGVFLQEPFGDSDEICALENLRWRMDESELQQMAGAGDGSGESTTLHRFDPAALF